MSALTMNKLSLRRAKKMAGILDQLLVGARSSDSVCLPLTLPFTQLKHGQMISSQTCTYPFPRSSGVSFLENHKGHQEDLAPQCPLSNLGCEKFYAMLVYYFSSIAVTKCHPLDGLKQQNSFLRILEVRIQNQGVSSGQAVSTGSRGDSGNSWCSLTCGGRILISSSVFAWTSSFFADVSPLLVRAPVIEFRAHLMAFALTLTNYMCRNPVSTP